MKEMRNELEEICNLIIQTMDESSLDSLSKMIPEENFSVVKSPKSGLLMMTAKDSFGVEFYLGEILVTEAEVEYRGKTGYAMLMSDEPHRALLTASVNAILQGDDEALKSKISEFLLQQKRIIDDKKKRESLLIAKTSVSFETMSKR